MPLKLTNQDITKIQCDAVVSLFGTSGVLENAPREYTQDGGTFISEASGPQCKYVICTDGGADAQNGAERSFVESCYSSSLSLAAKYRCESVAIPLMSNRRSETDKDGDLKVAMNAIGDFLLNNEMTVYLSVSGESSYEYNSDLYKNIIRYMGIHGNNLADTVCSAKTKEALEKFEQERFEYFKKLFGVGSESGNNSSRKNINRTEKTRSEEEKTDTAERKIEEDTLWGSPQVIRKAREHTTVYECRTGYHSHMRCEDKDEKAENKEDIFLGAMSERRFVLDKSFAELLFVMIDRSGMSDVECYKRANVDRKTFSKIKCNKAYRPSKATAVSFAIALKLNLYETNMLLETLGLTLSSSIEFDVIIKYFIESRIYDINLINETLFEFDQVLLGS